MLGAVSKMELFPTLRVLTVLTITCGAVLLSGCKARSIPTPPIDYSMNEGARQEALPSNLSPVSGDLNEVSDKERDKLIKLQHERLKKQQDEMDDLRRQKFQDGYYRSRYPTGDKQ